MAPLVSGGTREAERLRVFVAVDTNGFFEPATNTAPRRVLDHEGFVALVTGGTALDARPLDARSAGSQSGSAHVAWADERIVIPTPLTVEAVDGAVVWISGDGRSASIDVATSWDLRWLLRPRRRDEVHSHLADQLSVERLDDAVDRLAEIGLVERVARDVDDGSALGALERLRRSEQVRVRALYRAELEQRGPAFAVHTTTGRVPVLAVTTPAHHPNLALGMLLAYARTYDGGRLAEQFDLDPRWLIRKANLDETLDEAGPAVVLFSDYIWSSLENLELSRRVKDRSPGSVCIHGGPDVPREERLAELWMRQHTHVDVVVRNEGEVTLAEVLDVLGRHRDDLPSGIRELGDIPGLTYRDGDAIRRTPDRARIADLEELPSPYLAGLFDLWAEGRASGIILETNRGCPYGCTFCDWGQATMSRIRKFPLQRIFDEIEWAANAKIPGIGIADANFGIYARDVEIAEKIAEVRAATGFPHEVQTAFAKNTTKHLRPILRTLIDAGVMPQGTVSMQSFDQPTLDAVERSNIKTSQYVELLSLFREERLPITAELMIGLPGATTESFRADLQMCVDLEISPRIYRTLVLVNSPMNDPVYREKWQIQTDDIHGGWRDHQFSPGHRNALIVSSASYTADDLSRMLRLRDVFTMFEHYGLLRYVARWVRTIVGLEEVELFEALERAAREAPERYPVLAWVLETFGDHTAVPGTWERFTDDVAEVLVDRLGVRRGAELDTVMAVQVAHLPARGRRFPDVVMLDHDFAAWHRTLLEVKSRNMLTADREVPPLRSFGPAELVVEDPDDVCNKGLGVRMDATESDHWELRSAVSRVLSSWYQGR